MLCNLQERAGLVLASRAPAIGTNDAQSLNEWLDMQGLDRRLHNSDTTSSSPRYEISGIPFHIIRNEFIEWSDVVKIDEVKSDCRRIIVRIVA
jgi:hypothetical protein